MSASIISGLRTAVPQSKREGFYRAVGAAIMFLLAFGVLDDNEATLWATFGTGLVTLLFALLHATSTWRTAIYVFTGPLGSVLMVYGIVGDERWALIVAATGYAFGIVTAAAKTNTVAP